MTDLDHKDKDKEKKGRSWLHGDDVLLLLIPAKMRDDDFWETAATEGQESDEDQGRRHRKRNSFFAAIGWEHGNRLNIASGTTFWDHGIDACDYSVR